MFGFGFALVPFYDAICRALGVNSLVERERRPRRTRRSTMSRTVTIELDANAHNLPWRFRPAGAAPHGASGRAGARGVRGRERARRAGHRPGGRRATARRSPAQYFRKLECFCFTQQTLAAGETRRMPVVFVVDPHAAGRREHHHAVLHLLRSRGARRPLMAAMRCSKAVRSLDTVEDGAVRALIGVRRKADHENAPHQRRCRSSSRRSCSWRCSSSRCSRSCKIVLS